MHPGKFGNEVESNMQKVIVTGAKGFIGQHVVQLLAERNIQVYAIVRNDENNMNYFQNYESVQTILCDIERIEELPQLIKDRNIDACIHLAWDGSFGPARAEYELQVKNVKLALDTVKVLSTMRVKRFVGAGSLAEKDVLNYNLKDGTTPNAVSLYGSAKLSAQLMTKIECTKLGMEHIWCYISNTYGIGSTTNNFVMMACKKMLRKEHAAFTLGEQMYDFVYITDTARALCYATEKGKTNTSYYLGSGNPRKLKEYIRIIRDSVDPATELFLGEIPYNGISLTKEEYDISKLVIDTGYKEEISFEKGIRMTVDWLRRSIE